MKCDDFLIQINMHIDGVLDQAQTDLLFEHLHECENCQKRFDAYSTISLAVKNAEIDYPENLHSSIMQAVKAEKSKKTISFVRRYGAVAACAAVALIAGIGFFGLRDLSADNSNKAEPPASFMAQDCAEQKADADETSLDDAVFEESPADTMRDYGEELTAVSKDENTDGASKEEAEILLGESDSANIDESIIEAPPETEQEVEPEVEPEVEIAVPSTFDLPENDAPADPALGGAASVEPPTVDDEVPVTMAEEDPAPAEEGIDEESGGGAYFPATIVTTDYRLVLFAEGSVEALYDTFSDITCVDYGGRPGYSVAYDEDIQQILIDLGFTIHATDDSNAENTDIAYVLIMLQ